jgi:hypothetical protein
MRPDATIFKNVPRIVPTQEHLDALVGIWEIEGEMVRLLKEPETGVLVAMTTRGRRLNPIRVISAGTKMVGEPPH